MCTWPFGPDRSVTLFDASTWTKADRAAMPYERSVELVSLPCSKAFGVQEGVWWGARLLLEPPSSSEIESSWAGLKLNWAWPDHTAHSSRVCSSHLSSRM